MLVVTLVALSTPLNFFSPAANGGPIWVERVDYLDNGMLDQGDYSMAAVGAPVLAIGGSTLGPVFRDHYRDCSGRAGHPPTPLTGLQSYLGLRFYWAAMARGLQNTDLGGDNDIATLGMAPTLTVIYGN